MTEDLFRQGGADLDAERTERAMRAVRNFRTMQHGLSGYARAITGKRNITVELDQGTPRTDGSKIYFRPPLALGDNSKHNRLVCDKRDPETKLQRCPACAVREDVLIKIYHEIAHIAFGTFEPVSERAKVEVSERAIEEMRARGTAWEQKIRESFSKIPKWQIRSFLDIANLVSPYLPVIVNALEDARVDESMFKARRGTRVMFDAMTEAIFAEGIEMPDGTYQKWSERPLNSQILVGIFVLAAGYNYEGWFSPEVEEALKDEELNEIISRIDTLRSAEATYELAFPVLNRIRELGFCLNPNEEPEESDSGQGESGDSDEQEDQADSNESQDSGSEDQAPKSEDSDGDGEAGESDSDPGDEASDGESSDYMDSEPESSENDEGDAGEDDNTDDSSEGTGSSDNGAHDGGADEDSSSEQSDSRSDEEESDANGAAEPSDSSQDAPGESDTAPFEGSDQTGAPSTGSRQGDLSDSDGEEADDEPESEPNSEDDWSDGAKADDSESDEPVDTGADDGEGGQKTRKPNYGDPDTALRDVQIFSKHEVTVGESDEEPEKGSEAAQEAADNALMDKIIIQGLYFETPSQNVSSVKQYKYGTDNHGPAWEYDPYNASYEKQLMKQAGISAEVRVPESILGPTLLEMRRVFDDNQRAAFERHMRSGRINSKVLGRRAWSGDPRLFQKKRLPGKRSYAVLIGIDVSGSTYGVNIALAKRAAMAQAELCHRTGIDFAVYAHSANHDEATMGLSMDIYEIKSFDEPWGDKQQKALGALGSDAGNLDGHTIEYYRKMIERHNATDKIILYYSDGKMPAANHDEELEVLVREIQYCKAHKITLMGVGIRTDSPRRHGLDTVQVDTDEDLVKVVAHLRGAVLRNR